MHVPALVLALASLSATSSYATPSAATAHLGALQSPETEAPEASEDPRSKELHRILHLAGGGVLRAKSRWTGSAWEYRTQNQWASVPAAAVLRVELERDVLAEAKALARQVPKDDAGARARLADWMLRAGLVDEGVAELERALEIDPDQAGALALLREPPVPIRVPGAEAEELEEAIRLAAIAPRSLQECAAAALGRREDPASVMKALDDALESHSPRIRAFAALATRRLDPSANVKDLLGRAVLDGSEAVRTEAARALRDTTEPAVAIPVIRALGSSSPAIRSNAIEALGVMRFPAAVAPLVSRLASLSAAQGGGSWRAPAQHIFVGKQVAYIQDFDVEVAQFAAVADPQINTLIEGSVLDVRVIGVTETTVAVESRRIRQALGQISGASPGESNRAWLDWWERNKGEYGVKSAPAAAPRTGNSD
jgi:hypothetical protein